MPETRSTTTSARCAASRLPRSHAGPRCRRVGSRLVVVTSLLLAATRGRADALSDARHLFNAGQYGECLAACSAAIAGDGKYVDAWWSLGLRSEMAMGRYADALKTYEAASVRFPGSAELRVLGADAYRMNDRPADADAVLDALRKSASDTPWRYADPAGRVAVGRAMLQIGADARQVLESFFDVAKKQDPRSAEPHLASGQVALDKNDYALAAESFAAAIDRDPTNPDAFLGLARSHPEDDERATKALARALELNPRHADSLLFTADNAIDRENLDAAARALDAVIEVNPKEPRAWAYRAVLAHLAGDARREAECRDAALEPWKANPQVDFLIGRKLSQNYRFREGAAYQRRSLSLAAGYLPAKAQLAQDLLRLGQDDEGWRLTLEVFDADPYNVQVYNLVTLNDTLSKFAVLRSGPFRIRMDAPEAALFGPRVERLLARAADELCRTYGVTLDGPDAVTVEVFPQQKDFAIRTFGLPGGVGYLGVCFGPVITVNSPGSRGAMGTNFDAVLWHEFCHAVTLKKTRNRMPRWLSEGVSVYEERRASPTWGQVMTPPYREMILAGRATPLSKLSGAFLASPTPMHLQFAYFESSMVVEYVVERFGRDALLRVLDDLGNDVPVNVALSRHTEPIGQLDAGFAAWLKQRANDLAPNADLAQPDVPLDADGAAMSAWVTDHPNSFFGLLGLGRALLAEKKYAEAKAPLEAAAALYPTYKERGGPWLLLAAVNRATDDGRGERAALERQTALDAEAIDARGRLIELATAGGEWAVVRAQAEAMLAVNPLVPAPWRHLAASAEALGDRAAAIEARRALVLIDTVGQSENHYRLAKLLADDGRLAEARREVVRALEEAPRYREAHRLLLDLARRTEGSPATGSAPPATSPADRPTPGGRP